MSRPPGPRDPPGTIVQQGVRGDPGSEEQEEGAFAHSSCTPPRHPLFILASHPFDPTIVALICFHPPQKRRLGQNNSSTCPVEYLHIEGYYCGDSFGENLYPPIIPGYDSDPTLNTGRGSALMMVSIVSFWLI